MAALGERCPRGRAKTETQVSGVLFILSCSSSQFCAGWGGGQRQGVRVQLEARPLSAAESPGWRLQ